MSPKSAKFSATTALVALSLVATSFYAFSSGGAQPYIAVYLLVFSLSAIKRNRISLSYYPDTIIFTLFFTYAIIIDGYYSMQYGSNFLISCAQHAFDLLTFLSFSTAFKVILSKHNEADLTYVRATKIRRAIALGLALQVAIFYAGLGRYEFPPRYNGFFNDPNQMSYWVICLVCISFLLPEESNKTGKLQLAIYGLGLYIVAFETLSRSGTLGLLAIAIGLGRELGLKKIFSFALSGLILAGIFWLYAHSTAQTHHSVGTLTIASRVDSTNIVQQLRSRGYLLPLDYPSYLLFGAGHGAFYRFGMDHEIHSSLVGVIFYYGIIGSGLFYVAYARATIRLAPNKRFYALAPFLYGISTYGLRTPIFWVMTAAVVWASTSLHTMRYSTQAKHKRFA